MTHLDALKELAEKVDQAFLQKPSYLTACRFPNGLWQTAKLHGHQDKVWGAYNGSLDAAKALHEAVLPGWAAVVDMVSGEVGMHQQILWNDGQPTDEWEWMFEVDGSSDNPARAWLLAILKALIAQETDQ